MRRLGLREHVRCSPWLVVVPPRAVRGAGAVSFKPRIRHGSQAETRYPAGVKFPDSSRSREPCIGVVAGTSPGRRGPSDSRQPKSTTAKAFSIGLSECLFTSPRRAPEGPGGGRLMPTRRRLRFNHNETHLYTATRRPSASLIAGARLCSIRSGGG